MAKAKGTHNAMNSAMLAAEAVYKTVTDENLSPTIGKSLSTLSYYFFPYNFFPILTIPAIHEAQKQLFFTFCLIFF